MKTSTTPTSTTLAAIKSSPLTITDSIKTAKKLLAGRRTPPTTPAGAARAVWLSFITTNCDLKKAA